MENEMRKNIDRVKNFNEFINENIINIGYLKVEILNDTISNDGKNALVKIRCMKGSKTEIELLVFSSDLTSDKISNITNKF